MKIKIEPQTINVNIKTEKVYPVLEDLEVTPSGTEQHFKSEKYGFDNVTVKAVESEELNIIPNTENQIKEGMFNKVTVAGDSDLIPENIKEDVEIFGVKGTAQLRGEENAVFSVEASTGNTDVYTIKRKIVSIPLFDTSNVTNMYQMFEYCSLLTTIPLFDTSNVTNMHEMFKYCSLLTTIPLFDTSNVTNMEKMFYLCGSLKELPEINTKNVQNIADMFYSCYNLENIPVLDFSNVDNLRQSFYNCNQLKKLGGFKNLGKKYTATSNNSLYYELKLNVSTNLTHESLMNVINNLYDLNLTYDVANGGTLYTQKLTLGSTNISKLSAEEIAIATNKGWTVS